MAMNFVLPADWNVPQVFRNRVGQRVGRQRAMFTDGHLLLLLHRIPDGVRLQRQSNIFWRDPGGNWKSDRGDGVEALNRHITEFETLIDKLTAQVEKARGVEDYFAVMEIEIELKYSTNNLHKTLQQAREMIAGDKDIIDFRDRTGEIEYNANMLFADTRNELDFAIVKRNDEQTRNSHHMARSAHRLNVLAALFFPIMTICAVFGMNLKFGLETEYVPIPFFASIVAGLIIGCLLLQAVIVKKPPRHDSFKDIHIKKDEFLQNRNDKYREKEERKKLRM